MSNSTISQFANELKQDPQQVLSQLKRAGIEKSTVNDAISESDKQHYLSYLRSAHGGSEGVARSKITLTKRSTSEIKQADATGKARTINVVTRKKRTFVKREDMPVQQPVAELTPADSSSEAISKPLLEDEAVASINQIAQTDAPQSPSVAKEDVATSADAVIDAVMQTPQVEKAADESAVTTSEEVCIVLDADSSEVKSDDVVSPVESASKRQKRLAEEERERKEREAEQRAAKYLAQKQQKKVQESKQRKQVAQEQRASADERARKLQEERQKAEEEARQRAVEEAQRAKDLEVRRRKAESEAAAIRSMMSAPRKVLVAKKPVATPAEDATKKVAVNKATESAKKKDKVSTPRKAKEVKSTDLSSSWTPEDGRRKEIKTRGDTAATTAGRGSNWRSGGKGRREDKNQRRAEQARIEPVVHEARVLDVHVPETITVAELAHKMAVKASELIKILMKMGQMVTINQSLDQDTAMIIVEEMGHNAIQALLDDPEAFSAEEATKYESELISRAPVVTVMGHVDHGKTSLLDYIRRSKVASGEAGGITQHIGAYHVTIPRGIVSFLDTPGHEAFTAMRARGAQATDIVVLVVAADDGVMPQTKEAIQHAKAAKVPIVVAITKSDKPEANPDRVTGELVSEGVVPEAYGGDSPFIQVSSKTGMGIDDLLENLLLQAEMLELKAPVDAMAKGLVIEAQLDKGRGPVATVLVQSGTLKVGDVVLAGQTYGRVRAMNDETSQRCTAAGPSIPVEIQGLTELPQAGDEFMVMGDERRAREIATYRAGRFRNTKLAKQQAAKLENMFSNLSSGEVKLLPILIKSDVQGSQEALSQSLLKLSTDEIKVQVVYSGVGGISESDVNLATASKGVIIGFNVRSDANARRAAESNGVDIRYYGVIYDAVEELKTAMTGMLAPEQREEVTGTAEIRTVFVASKIGTVAGSYITSGFVVRNSNFRLLRENVVIYSGAIESLRRIKEDVREVREGFECGIKLKNCTDIREGDQLEFFEVKQIARTL